MKEAQMKMSCSIIHQKEENIDEGIFISSSKKDASKVFAYWSDEEVTRYMNIEPFTTLYQAESMIALLQSLTKEGKQHAMLFD
ncbi:hypothetical protein MUB16_28205 [Priestia sp. OVL9]|nr:hypothetical protein [Priestia sp. OVL9]